MSDLKIGWATPWNTRSAIAQVADEIATELTQRGHTLTILRTESGDALGLPVRSSSYPVRLLSEVPSAELQRDFDIIVAHIGDNYYFHGAVIPRLHEFAAVGIFHDAFLADLANEWVYCPTGGGDALLRRIVGETYGAKAWPPEEPFWTSVEDVARRRPMLEWIARQTVAAVAHAGHYTERLRNACLGPVTVIQLACEFSDLPPPPLPWERTTIAAIGHVNPNKRIDQLIMAISASPILRRRCRVRLIGQAAEAERERLCALAEAVEISPPEFLGWVSDEDLRLRLRDVDAISCLRNPVLEGASASLILALSSGRPTLVSGHGCYAEVPEDAVMVCAPDNEARDAMRHLERLVADPELGKAMGERARAVVKQRHTASVYADALLPFLEQIIREKPIIEARRQLRATLSEFGLAANDAARIRIEAVPSRMWL